MKTENLIILSLLCIATGSLYMLGGDSTRIIDTIVGGLIGFLSREITLETPSKPL